MSKNLPPVTLIIPAAGRGLRMGGPVPKQLCPLGDRSILRQTLDRFAGFVEECILTVNEIVEEPIQAELSRLPPSFSVRLVPGGAERQLSVLNALREAKHDFVLVHDAVRPFVSAQAIRACIRALEQHPSAVVALPCRDTVKQTERPESHLVAKTLDRRCIHLAQTPQGLRRSVLLPIYEKACDEGFLATDDAALATWAGLPSALVEGSSWNLKITTQEDYTLAQALVPIILNAPNNPKNHC